jgi:signal transduction histidine kinase
MSYRTFKRVIGETSLERKCRFLFGAALLVLILGSFLWYGLANERLVGESTRSNCQLLVEPVLVKLHVLAFAEEENKRGAGEGQLIERIVTDLQDVAYDAKFLSFDEVNANALDANPNQRWKIEQAVGNELAILNELKQKHEKKVADWIAREASESSGDAEELAPDELQSLTTFQKFVPAYKDQLSPDHKNYYYYEPVLWKESCVTCHITRYGINYDPQKTLDSQLGQLPFRAVRISVPYDPMYRKINQNRALLLAMAIITVFLSMIALYIVVRYVIVKPLQHLQDVSEQVEQGNYDARAEIETNDEFEDLAHAYNRMLRHMVDAQSELQTANDELDGKVDELAQANMQLFESNRVKSEFLANVSHELRTPLNSIIGFSDVLQNIESLNDKEQRYASNIGRSGRVLLEMINDILDLAKMESGRMQVRPSEFSIENIVRAQCDVIRTIAEDKNISVTIDCPAGLPDMFQDQAKVQQILTNLLSNAIKFTPEGGRVKVIVAPHPADEFEEPAEMLMTVRDTGVGIADEDRELIFEKFRQATATRGSDNLTREFSGTGLGLSIVRELSKLMQGRISFVSELGKGSAFTVRLPWLFQQQAESSKLSKGSFSQPSGEGHVSEGNNGNGQMETNRALPTSETGQGN